MKHVDTLYQNFCLYWPNEDIHIEKYKEIKPGILRLDYDDRTVRLYDINNHGLRKVYSEKEMIESNEYMKQDFSYWLQYYINLRYTDQQTLSNATKISQSLLSRYINGKTLPSIMAVRRLAHALNCKENDFSYSVED